MNFMQIYLFLAVLEFELRVLLLARQVFYHLSYASSPLQCYF
jgi:hypothetical protein